LSRPPPGDLNATKLTHELNSQLAAGRGRQWSAIGKLFTNGQGAVLVEGLLRRWLHLTSGFVAVVATQWLK
jgi:hypothetical protein